MINTISIKTGIGWISAFENKGKIFRIKFGKLKKQKKSRILENFRNNIYNFFNNKTENIEAPHKMEGTKVQKKVWAELKKIKKGCTKTYGKIGRITKISPRHVGKICGQNKLLLLVPCHRVIKSDGGLGGFTSIGGIKLKKKLLYFEKFGITRI